MFNARQFRDLVTRVLMELHPDIPVSDVAVCLLMGTAAQESRLGTFLRQCGGGPALGVFQMEVTTFNWLRDKYPRYLRGRQAQELEWDLKLGIIAARLRYWAMPEDLPPSSSPGVLAAYWKQHYNTPAGGGRIEDFVRNYQSYVEGR